jgi:hypothetical protein
MSSYSDFWLTVLYTNLMVLPSTWKVIPDRWPNKLICFLGRTNVPNLLSLSDR